MAGFRLGERAVEHPARPLGGPLRIGYGQDRIGTDEFPGSGATPRLAFGAADALISLT